MIYFDNAATTFPKPLAVSQMLTKASMQYGGNPGRGGHSFSVLAGEQVYRTREAAASFFHTVPERVIFTNNCTTALNIAIKGLIKENGHIVISDLEHNAVYRPVHQLSQKGITEYTIAKTYDDDDQKTVRSFSDEIREDTCLVVCTHASNVSGHVLPVSDIGALCKRRKIPFVIDAAQSAGVVPIDFSKTGACAVCVPGHKGLYGPAGTGMLLLYDDRLLQTMIEGGTGSVSSEAEMPDFYPDRLEAGTLNTSGILALAKGIRFVQEKTPTRLFSHEESLCRFVWEHLSRMPHVFVCPQGKNHVPIVSFSVLSKHSEQTAAALNRMGFALRGGLHCAPLAHAHYGTMENGLVRFAPSAFNTLAECRWFVNAVYQHQNQNEK